MSSKVIKAPDLVAFIGKARNRIHLVGVELEGGWTKLPEGVNLVRDGSVQIPTPEDALLVDHPEQMPRTPRGRAELNRRIEHEARKVLFTGELPSEPLEVAKVPTWMRAYYPTHVNGTCGLHVHMSFKSALHYQKLMRPEYQDAILDCLNLWGLQEGLKKEHPFWNRILGQNQYCKKEFHADAQVAKTGKSYNHAGASRYTVINYPWSLHGTLECRVLPMFEDVELAIRAVKFVLDVTNAFLVKTATKEERVKMDLVVDAAIDTLRDHRQEFI